jgi:response regulator RpfG family c-di-GMP phosphodiesterase
MKFITDSTIRTKINIISITAILIIFGMLISLYSFTNYLQNNFDKLQTTELRLKKTTNSLTILLSQIQKNLLLSNVSEEPSIKRLNSNSRLVFEYFTIIEQLIKEIPQYDNSSKLILLGKLKAKYSDYHEQAKLISSQSTLSSEKLKMELSGLDTISLEIINELNVYASLADLKFYERINDVKIITSTVLNLFLIVAVLSLLAFMFFGSYVKSTIIQSLNNLNHGIDEFFKFLFQEKHTTDNIKVLYNDELGEVAQYINNNIQDVELLIKNEREFQKTLQSEVTKQTQELQNLNEEIVSTQKDILLTMGAISESRSKETGNHVKRVASYSRLFAKKLGFSDEVCELIYSASPMHDIGKIAIPDEILTKPGKLDEHEFEIMKRHTVIGYQMLKDSPREILAAAAIIAHEHHEKWDGTGYPNNKSKEGIHIYARITTISDVFDALSVDRYYKKAWKIEDVMEYIKSENGKYFDPQLVGILIDNLDEFLEIREFYKEDV